MKYHETKILDEGTKKYLWGEFLKDEIGNGPNFVHVDKENNQLVVEIGDGECFGLRIDLKEVDAYIEEISEDEYRWECEEEENE